MPDMKNLSKLSSLGELVPEQMKAFQAMGEAAFSEGAVPLKYKELIALGVALTTQCEYCLEVHKKNALKAGASEQEIAETAFVAAALRAGGAVTHATHLI